jgi:hypothetical protein
MCKSALGTLRNGKRSVLSLHMKLAIGSCPCLKSRQGFFDALCRKRGIPPVEKQSLHFLALSPFLPLPSSPLIEYAPVCLDRPGERGAYSIPSLHDGSIMLQRLSGDFPLCRGEGRVVSPECASSVVFRLGFLLHALTTSPLFVV